MLRLYDSRLSGNGWKVRILLKQLGIPFQRILLDLSKGEQAAPEFRTKSKFTRIPVLELEDGRTIVETPAILFYLADGTPFLPDDKNLRADILGWMTFEQYDLLRALQMPRVYHLRGQADQMAAKISEIHDATYPALSKLETWLIGHRWLAADRYTIADINMFGYVSMAHEGKYDMSRFPAIGAWLDRVRAQPGWIPLLEGTSA